MKKIVGIIASLSFLFAWGIVGTVEQGASARLMVLTIPALVVIGICAAVYEKLS